MGILRSLDSDLRSTQRKPIHADRFDPRWQLAMYHGLNVGPHGQIGRPYCVRGGLPFVLSGGASGNTLYGPALIGATGGTNHGGCEVLAANISFGLNTVEGTIITTFRAKAASGSPPINNTHYMTFQQYVGGTWIVAAMNNFSGTCYFGWYNNGTDSRVTVSQSGLWAAGDLVVVGFSYSPLGTRAFVKGKLVASSGTAPSTFNTRTTGGGLNLGISEDPNPSAGLTSGGDDMLNAVILDRALRDTEWSEIASEPLSWMFDGDDKFIAISAQAVAATGIVQTAVTMM